jgi:hypothetical protein
MMEDHRLVGGEKTLRLLGCGSRSVNRAGAARRRIAGDSASPRIRRLAGRPGVRIGEPVADRHVHHHEGIQNHLKTAVFQMPDKPHHAGVGRRAPVSRHAVNHRDGPRGGTGEPGDGPGVAVGDFGRALHARSDRAVAGTQIVAEPAHHKRNALQVRAQRLQGVEGGDHVRRRLELMLVLGPRRPKAEGLRDRRDVVAKLARAGDQAHGADHGAETFDGAHDLEGELRHAMAELGEAQALEHHVGETAVGGRVIRALLGDDQRIGRLAFVAAVEAHRERGQVEFAPVRPHTAHEGDRAFAQANREVREVGIGRADGRLG